MNRLIIGISALFLLLNIYSCNSVMAGENDGGAFEYRDVYLPDYTKDDNASLKLDHIDEAWGIWGHNLPDILPDNPSKQIYAREGGGYNHDQFCFSNTQLFNYISDYIHGNYLLTDSVRFAILPNDNSIVCLCSECVNLGNTKGDASPAVVNMITRLSEKFPQHKFFTSHYSTTSALPKEKLPENAGVIISAIDYPLTLSETPEEKNFLDLIEQWKEKTDRIYVWDYVSNFDDYFTPYPVFSVMQRRLQNYRDAGVTGVFLNGSGDDYTSLGALKKSVLADLLYDPDADWRELVRAYADENYPEAGADIVDFIFLQENAVSQNGVTLPMYEGVAKAIDTYLPEKEFIDFYNKLVEHKRNAADGEKEELETLTDAMAFTMLELKRINCDIDNADKLRERLGRLAGMDINYYSEGCWSVSQYLDEYKLMDEEAKATENSNLLKGVKLEPLVPLDEDYTDITIVTDGLLGIPSNYHNGNLIMSSDPEMKIRIPRVGQMSKLKVWMVYNPGFKIGLPEEVYITAGGLKQKSQIPTHPIGSSEHSVLEFNIPEEGEIVLHLWKSPDYKTMAIDEIQAF